MKIFKKVGRTWPIDDFLLHSQSFPFTGRRNRCKFLHSAPTQEGRKRPAQKMRKQRRVAISCIPFALLASSPFSSHSCVLFPSTNNFPFTSAVIPSAFLPSDTSFLLPSFQHAFVFRCINKNKNFKTTSPF